MNFADLVQLSRIFKKIFYSAWMWGFLFIALFLFLFLAALFEYRKRRALPENQKKTPFFSFLKILFRWGLGVFQKIPMIALTLLILFFCERLLNFTVEIHEIAENQKKIQELTAVVKNLSRIERVARLQLQSFDEMSLTMKVRLSLLKHSGKEFQNQIFYLKGRELWIDSLSINFDYLFIEKGEAKNIAIPYALYTEKIPPKEALPIQNLFDEKGVPSLFRFEADQIFGIEVDRYDARLSEIFSSPQKMKAIGVRSIQGNALHLVPQVGAIYELRSLGTGGLTLIKERF